MGITVIHLFLLSFYKFNILIMHNVGILINHKIKTDNIVQELKFE